MVLCFHFSRFPSEQAAAGQPAGGNENFPDQEDDLYS